MEEVKLVFMHDEFVELIGTDYVITTRTVVDSDGNIISKGLNRYAMSLVGKNKIPQKISTETKQWLTMYV